MNVSVGIIAGNQMHIEGTAVRPEGSISPVQPSTAKVAVTDQAGISTAVPATVTYLSAASLMVTADWLIPDDYPDQILTITAATEGALKSKGELNGVRITAARVPVMP